MKGQDMKKYVSPIYDLQSVETEDVMLVSPIIKDEGTSTLGNISGYKGSFSADFDSIF